MNSVKLNNDTRIMSDKEILKRSFSYIRPHANKFIISMIFMVIVILLELAGPYISGIIVSRLYSFENYKYLSVVALSIGYLSCVLTSSMFMYLESMLLQKTGQKIVYQLRQDVFAHIESLAIAQINEVPIGKLVSRVTSDTNAVNELYTNILINSLKNILSLFGVIGMMFVLHAKLALYMIIAVPLVAFFSYLFRYLSKKAYRNVRHEISAMNAFLNENLSGMKITQVFNQEERKENEFNKVNGNLVKARSKQNIVFTIFRPIVSFIYMSSIAALVYLSLKVFDLGKDEVGLQILWSFYEYVGRFFEPIQSLADQINGLQQAFAASERLFLLLDLRPELEDEDDSIEIDNIKGEIIFDHVWFAYEGEKWILKDVSFKVNPKEVVAFVGATGSGKTTILSLIVRNYDIQKGNIYIDGINIKKIKIKSLRKSIGQMLQDVFLFSGTIYSNLTLRDESYSLDEVKKASEFTGSDVFISKLNNNYQEQVLEKGSNFSAGERQLLSFTRTVLHKPSLMILDEATANIDTETEVLIQKSLEKMMDLGTMLIVAHRLSTIQHANQIIVLQNGEIIEKGNHQSLLRKKGYYYNLYRLQFENEKKEKYGK